MLQIAELLVKSWAEHLRQHERSTLANLEIEENARSFQDEGNRPTVRHWIGGPVEQRRSAAASPTSLRDSW